MAQFYSDNVTGVCPEVMDAILAANAGTAASYGLDAWTATLQSQLSEIFEKDVTAFPVATGTAANALALAALVPVFGKVYCHALSHINTDECGAPEFFTGGAKLIPMPGEVGKISAKDLAGIIRGAGDVHQAQPAAVSIAQACETGTVYGPDEIAEIGATAHARGLKVHMDGARFANALVALDVSPAEMTWKSGVDVLSLGGTKNGCLAAEAVVFFDPEMIGAMPYLRKRAGHLVSKMRFISAQMNAYLSDGVWLRNARHANAMAERLSDGLVAHPQVELAYPTQANEVFVRLPAALIAHLEQDGFVVNTGELGGPAVRFVTAWDTEPEAVDRLLSAVSRHFAKATQPVD